MQAEKLVPDEAMNTRRRDGQRGVDPVAVAEAATGRRVVTADVGARIPIAYDPYLPGRVVERITGMATLRDSGPAEWAAVVKRTTGPGLQAARRELGAYRIGLADPEPVGGLRAPALLASDE